MNSNTPPEHIPNVAVIITCYNFGRCLGEAVNSVLMQAMQNFELIIVDDVFMDESYNNLLANYQKPKTKVFPAEHRCLAAARDLAIA